MEILKVLALRGPNIWARFPVLEAWVDLGALKDSPSDEMPGFNDRLMGWLPTMVEHRCSVGERGGFFQRLRRGTYLAHILEHVTLELQTLAGTEVGFGKARETSQEGVYKVAIRYQDESLGRACLETAHALCLAAVNDSPFDVEAELRRLRDLADRVCLGPSTSAIVEAARTRGIPSRRLNAGSLVQLGYGARQRRIWTAETDRTSAIAESIAQDKELTKTLLRSAGVPVPEGRIVDSPEDAWSAAEDCGLPVVVKPRDANHGRGVFIDLTEAEQVANAFEEAAKEGSGVIVERFVPGVEHRLLVVGSRLIAACKGEELFVTGNGRDTVRELIDLQINSDPRRGEDETLPLAPVEFTAQLDSELNRQGMTLESIPENATQVLIQRSDNLSTDVTDSVHPSIAEHAVLAAQVVGLDVAGLDIVARDISLPLEDQGGAVVEVNAGPGLLMHLKPAVGKPRPVGEAIVETLFPNGEDGRIPIAAVTGTNGKTIVTRLLAHLLRQSGQTVGMACSDGIYIDSRCIEQGDCSGPGSARSVLMNPGVDAAVFEAGRGGILREGLGFDKCDVAVVTNIHAADHLGQSSIDTPEQMFTVKRTPVDVVLPGGAAVLNAADPLVAEMAPLSAGAVIFFALDAAHPVIVTHCQAGKRAVVFRDGAVVLLDGLRDAALLPLDRIPLARFSVTDVPATERGPVLLQVENVLAAVAAAWGLDLPLSQIESGLATFNGDLDDCPGRLNVLAIRRATVLVDYCRNLSALAAVTEALAQLSHGRRAAAYAVPADRRDIDILAQGKLLGSAFDRIWLYPPSDADAAGQRRVIELLRQGIAEAACNAEIVEAANWDSAFDLALAALAPGQLLLMQAESVAHAVQRVRGEIDASATGEKSEQRGVVAATMD